jgi:hypothetical protein
MRTGKLCELMEILYYLIIFLIRSNSGQYQVIIMCIALVSEFKMLVNDKRMLFTRSLWIHSDGEMCIFYYDVWTIGLCKDIDSEMNAR